MDEDIEAYRRNLADSLGRYGDLFPSLRRRLDEIAHSDDPFIRSVVEDLVAAANRREASRSAWFADTYGLTATEARIALSLAGGGSITDYAERYGVSEQTVRSQLKSIFAKTGINRQSALAGLVMGHPIVRRE